MKTKKLLLPVIILAVAVLAMTVYSLATSVAKKPTITEEQFPFSITYELNGETKTIQDVYSVRYEKNAGYTDTKTRVYVGKIGDMSEGDTFYTIQEDKDGRIVLNTKLYPDYLMGDTEYDYFSCDVFEPQILYYDLEEIEYTDEETLSEQGVKLVSWEYPTPIENSFIFSHISIFNSEVVFPTLLISVLALIAIIIFAKKEKEFVRKPIDVISTVLNYIVGALVLPFFTIFAYLIDITGDNESVLVQIMYFIPAIIVLCIAASVSLRRKGYGKKSLIIQIVGPVVFALILVVTMLFVGRKNNEEQETIVDYSSYSFTDVSWTRDAEQDIETIRFGSGGEFSYFCACGNSVNDSDLCEGYTYDDASKTITLNCVETTDEMITVIRIVKCDEKELHLDFDGEIRVFTK